MKLLAFADLHLDVPFSWAREPVARMRRANRRRTLENIIALAQAESVDALLCAGDLFEQDRITPDTFEFLRGAFARSGLRTFLAPGNHDWLGTESPYLQGEWGDNVTLFRRDRLEPVELGQGVTLWGAAHLVPANTDDFFANFHVDRGGVNLVVAHASERSMLPIQGRRSSLTRRSTPPSSRAPASTSRCWGTTTSRAKALVLPMPGTPILSTSVNPAYAALFS